MFQYFEAPIIWPPDVKNWLIGKDPNVGKDWRQEENGKPKDKMIGWHHWLSGHELEQAPRVSEGEGSLGAIVHGVGHDWVTELNWCLKKKKKKAKESP